MNVSRLLLAFFLVLASSAARAENHAVVLLYHNVDNDTPESTSVKPAVFERHLKYLWDNNFFVLPLAEILDAIAAGKPLPENSIAITFDDAYESVHRVAWPALRERRWPFTVFVSTQTVDAGYGNYMSWSQIRELLEAGGTIGNHGLNHAHPLLREPGENKADWLARFRRDVLEAAQRIEGETGATTKLYAYPYGEFSRDVEEVVADLGLYGLGQQSGAIGADTSLTAAPRFPISTAYADDKDFSLRVHSRPLPVQVLAPRDRLLARGAAAPTLEMRLEGDDYAAATVACFTSDGTRIPVSWEGEQVFRIRAPSPLPPGRSKYTCTAPYAEDPSVFGWYSYLWITEGGEQ